MRSLITAGTEKQISPEPPPVELYLCRIDRKGVHDIPYEKAGTSQSTEVPLVPEQLIVKAGAYRLGDCILEMQFPGVYVMALAPKTNLMRIVLDEQDPVYSALLVCQVAGRGNADDGLSTEQLTSLCQNRFVSLTCGRLATLVKSILDKAGMRSRRVSTCTLLPRNGFNDGHELLEVFDPTLQRWLVVDVDKKCMAFDKEQPLSVVQLCSKLRDGADISLRGMPNTVPVVDWFGFRQSGTEFDFQFLEFYTYSTTEGYLRYLRRICQLPMIREASTRFACSALVETVKDPALQDVIWLDEEQFMQRFYP